MKYIGVIKLDDFSGRLLCSPKRPEDHRMLISLIQQASPESRCRADAGSIALSISQAVALYDVRDEGTILWEEAAIEFISRFVSGYSVRNAARRRLIEITTEYRGAAAPAHPSSFAILDQHQHIAVTAMTDELIDGLCLFDEQGSGKTVMTIHAFDHLASSGRENNLLIFAPKNMLPTWKSDFHKFMGDKYRVHIVTGGKESKLNSLVTPADVYVTNFESAESLEGALRSFLRRNKGKTVLVVDESFFVKNPKAIRSAAIRRLRNLCERCWMLCGTPAPNAAIDVVHQFDIADCGVTFHNTVLPKDPKTLRGTIQSKVESRGLYLRRLKSDVLPDLSPKRFERVSVEMDATQREIYEKTLTGLIHDVAEVDNTSFRKLFTSFLARRMALLQIASNPKLVYPEYSVVPPKQKALDHLLEEFIMVRGEKVVLWSFFRSTLDQLCTRYTRYGAVRLDGSVTDTLVRGEAVRRFQEDTEVRLFIANPAAAGAGITLTAGRIAIYESFPTQTAHFLQSVDRIHRRGQTRETHYYFLLSSGTLDEVEYERLMEKDRMGFQLFGDEPPKVHTREFFLKELQDALSRLR